jgi:allantoin racemase
MRIWHQSMAALDDYGAYLTCLDGHVKSVASPDTTVTLHGARPGSYLGRAPAQVLRYPYAKHLIQAQAVEHCLQAQAEGYDAVAMATFGDPFLTECRSVVDIPVASMPESAALVGCSCADRMALVTLGPGNVRRVVDLVARMGLSSRVCSVVAVDPAITEADLAAALEEGDLAVLVDRFTEAAQSAIKTGADVVIPAEGMLNEVLFQAGCHRIGDVPVMDALGVLIAYTEMLVQLRTRTGLSVGRRWTYPKPDADLLGELRRRKGLPVIGGDDQ